jgi:hypothetical protein
MGIPDPQQSLNLINRSNVLPRPRITLISPEKFLGLPWLQPGI